MAEVSLKVLVAGRTYPLSVKEEDELLVINVEQMIKDKMKEFEQKYGIKDKQDLLAMSALNLMVALHTKPQKSPELEKDIQQLDLFISDYLQKESIA
jgi:cell division protein ZapA